MSGNRSQTPDFERNSNAALAEPDRIFTIHQEQAVMFLNGADTTPSDEPSETDLRLPVPHMYSA